MKFHLVIIRGMKKIKIGSDFSGVGAFNQALKRLGIDYEEIFACDMDKYARQTFIENYGEPNYFPENVYERDIPNQSLDIYMTSPPCQAFSLAGKRKGEKDDRGILFYNSHEFIVKNKPRYFIFENVKGLLSDNEGKTFSTWLNYLAGKSINGLPVMFPEENAVPYHVYYKVLNAKHYEIPQNRERVFIVGIRDDADNNFSFPKAFPLKLKIKDVLEDEVPEKYFLSSKMLDSISFKYKKNGEVANLNKGGERGSVFSKNASSISCLSATDFKQPKQILEEIVGTYRPHFKGENFRKSSDNNAPCITARAREDGDNQVAVMIKTNNKKGYEKATTNDTINYQNPKSKTRRGRVGKSVAQTLDTNPQQAIIVAQRGRKNEKGSYNQQIEINQDQTSNTITQVQKDNMVVYGGTQKNCAKMKNGLSPCLTEAMGKGGGHVPFFQKQYKIRRLTPRECFRLMDFPDSFSWSCSDSQAYKQAGNSIVVNVLAQIINKLKL